MFDKQAIQTVIEKRRALAKKISAILADHDPEGLIRMGAPPDEYDGEADDIAFFLSDFHGVPSVAAISEAIKDVFSIQFCTAPEFYPEGHFDEIAENVRRLL